MSELFNKRITKKYLVSIIMPSFNSSEFIEIAIKSVIDQTYENWELIIIDNGSEDNTINIINKLSKSNKKISLIKNNCNRGPGFARNLGLKKARGAYISFLDSDDFWDNNFLNEMINFAISKNHYFVYCPYYLYKNNFYILNKVLLKANVHNILVSNPLSCLAVLIEKEKLNYKFNEYFKTHEDIDLWIKIINKHGNAYCYNKSLAFYRQRDKSLSSNKIKNAIDRWKFLRVNMKFNYLKTFYYFIKYVLYGINKYIK